MSESQRKTVFCEKVHTHARHGLLTSSSNSVEEWEEEVSVHELACHFHLLHFWGTDTGGAGATCSSSALSERAISLRVMTSLNLPPILTSIYFGLNPQAPVELDLEVVQQAYRAAQRLSTVPTEPQRAALAARCQQAPALVRGPFLDGFWLGEESPFDEWVLQEQQWQVRVQLLCERLSSWQEGGFELEQVLTVLHYRFARQRQL